MEAAVERANLARQLDARRVAPHDEDGRPRLAAGIVRHLRHRQEQVGLGTAGDEGLDARDDEHLAPPHGRGARALAGIGESERRRQLAAQHGQQEALALRARGHAQEPAVAAEDESAQRALGARDLLVERGQSNGPEPAAAQLDRLRQPVEAELGRARPGEAPERGTRLRRVDDLLALFSGQELSLEEGAQTVAKRGELRGQRVGIHDRGFRGPARRVRPERDAGERDLGRGGDAEARRVPRRQAFRKVLHVLGVDLAVVGRVLDEERHLHHAVERRAGGPQDRLDIFERPPRLLGGRPLARRAADVVARARARDEDEPRRARRARKRARGWSIGWIEELDHGRGHPRV